MRPYRVIAASAFALLVLSGCGNSAESQAQPEAPPVSVATPLARQVTDWDEFVGRFEAVQTVDVRARVGGYIQAVHFRDGQMVRRGQLLFTLDPRPAQAALAAARASVAQAEAQAGLARAEFARAEGLLEAQAVSRAEFDSARAAVSQAEAALASARANVRARQLDLEFTRVTAPSSGRVSDRRVDVGNLVAGGSSAADVLTTIVSGGPIHFTFEGSEALLLKYQRDARTGGAAPVRIRLQDEGEYRWSGTVDFTDNAIDPSSGTIRLRAVVNNADGFLTPGMFGHARVAGSGAYQALLVPETAIVTDGPRRVVYVVGPDGVVAPKPVQLGPTVDGLRVVRAGLAPDDRVIVNGLQRAQPGQPVTPRNTEITIEPREESQPVTTAQAASTATIAD